MALSASRGVRERGIPERIKGTPWARWWDGPPGKHHRVVDVVDVDVSAASPAGIHRGDRLSRVWEEKRRGVDPRAARSKAFPHERVARCTGVTGPPSPPRPATAAYACIRAWTSAKRRIYALLENTRALKRS